MLSALRHLKLFRNLGLHLFSLSVMGLIFQKITTILCIVRAFCKSIKVRVILFMIYVSCYLITAHKDNKRQSRFLLVIN